MARWSKAVVPTAAALLFAFAGAGASAQDAKRGEYIFALGGCQGCHTADKEKPLAGGRALKTPFGTFYTPNITPDPGTGIGRWTDADLKRALHEGVSPDGSHYFPAFPYTSYTGMTDQDIRDLRAYLFTRQPIVQRNRDHDLDPPFGWRYLMTGWKALFFTEGPQPVPANATAEVRRGAYIVQALGHCGECHTPRNRLGGLDRERWLGGTSDGPGGAVPNISPHPDKGIGKWSPADIAGLLQSGMTPDGDFVGGEMAEVVEHGGSKMTAEDLNAVAAYLKAIPPIDFKPARRSN